MEYRLHGRSPGKLTFNRPELLAVDAGGPVWRQTLPPSFRQKGLPDQRAQPCSRAHIDIQGKVKYLSRNIDQIVASAGRASLMADCTIFHYRVRVG